jgi:hypothetical protein
MGLNYLSLHYTKRSSNLISTDHQNPWHVSSDGTILQKGHHQCRGSEPLSLHLWDFFETLYLFPNRSHWLVLCLILADPSNHFSLSIYPLSPMQSLDKLSTSHFISFLLITYILNLSPHTAIFPLSTSVTITWFRSSIMAFLHRHSRMCDSQFG